MYPVLRLLSCTRDASWCCAATEIPNWNLKHEWIRARTVFRIGSVSKTLTALAVLQLVDAGTLDLQRDVREYLPDVPLRYGATMHQLLTHTAGLDERFAGAYTDSTGTPRTAVRTPPTKSAGTVHSTREFL